MIFEARYLVWDTVSMAWTEIGLDHDDYPRIARELIALGVTTWEEVDSVARWDVCASFAWDTFLIFPCMLWIIMPDWGYDEAYLKSRMERWESRPRWYHFINPVRALSYPLALSVSLTVRRRLMKAFLAEQCRN